MNRRMITKSMLTTFENDLVSQEKSKATIEKYLRDVKAFTEYVNEKPVTRELVLQYKEMLIRSKAASSVNSMLVSMNSFLNFMGWHDLKVKQLKLQRQIYYPEEKELTKNEYFSLIKTAENRGNERLSLIIQTICATGIRVSELEYITVEAVRCGKTEVSCKSKTRTVFIVSRLRKKLLSYIKKNEIQSGRIFVTKNGKAVNRSNIWSEMKALCKQAGVIATKVFPHNLRHLFAKVFYQAEKDIAKLADILGHSSINTTRIYIMTTGAEHRRKMENMHLVM